MDSSRTELFAAVALMTSAGSVLVRFLAMAALADSFGCEVATGAERAASGGAGFAAEVVAFVVGAGTDDDWSGEVHLGLLSSLPLRERELRLFRLPVEEDDLRGVDLGLPALLARLLVLPLRGAE